MKIRSAHSKHSVGIFTPATPKSPVFLLPWWYNWHTHTHRHLESIFSCLPISKTIKQTQNNQAIDSDSLIFFWLNSSKSKSQRQHRHRECARVTPTTTSTCSSITITQEFEPNHIYEPFDQSVSLIVDAQFDVNHAVQ